MTGQYYTLSWSIILKVLLSWSYCKSQLNQTWHSLTSNRFEPSMAKLISTLNFDSKTIQFHNSNSIKVYCSIFFLYYLLNMDKPCWNKQNNKIKQWPTLKKDTNLFKMYIQTGYSQPFYRNTSSHQTWFLRKCVFRDFWNILFLFLVETMNCFWLLYGTSTKQLQSRLVFFNEISSVKQIIIVKLILVILFLRTTLSRTFRAKRNMLT